MLMFKHKATVYLYDIKVNLMLVSVKYIELCL